MKVGLRIGDARCWSKLSVGVNLIAAGLRWLLATLTCWGYNQSLYFCFSLFVSVHRLLIICVKVCWID